MNMSVRTEFVKNVGKRSEIINLSFKNNTERLKGNFKYLLMFFNYSNCLLQNKIF